MLNKTLNQYLVNTTNVAETNKSQLYVTYNISENVLNKMSFYRRILQGKLITFLEKVFYFEIPCAFYK